MASDNLMAVLAEIRDEIDNVPEEAWQKIRIALMREVGGQSVYVPRQSKRNNLEISAAAGEQVTAEQLAKILGISARRVRQLRKIL